MDYEVIQINNDTWRIEEDGARFFLLTGKERALLVDSGMMVHNAREIAESLTKLPLSLLNTHADMDHIGSNAQFESFYMHPAEETNYRRSGGTGTIIPIREGDTLDLGGRELEIIHLSGHTPGSVAVLDKDRRVLISGDPIQAHGNIFMFGEHRNMQDYIASLARLEKRTDAFDEIWPSHADFPVEPELIEKLRDGAERILAGEVAGRLAAFHEQKITAYDLGFATILCDR